MHIGCLRIGIQLRLLKVTGIAGFNHLLYCNTHTGRLLSAEHLNTGPYPEFSDNRAILKSRSQGSIFEV